MMQAMKIMMTNVPKSQVSMKKVLIITDSKLAIHEKVLYDTEISNVEECKYLFKK